MQGQSEEQSDSEDDKQVARYERVISYAGKMFAVMDAPYAGRDRYVYYARKFKEYTAHGVTHLLHYQGFWAMSPDLDFVEDGSESGMNYSEMCDEFLKVLLNGLEMRSKHTLEVFAEWDSIFFPRTKDHGLSARAGLAVDANRSLASRATDRAMARLNRDEQLPDQDEEITN